MTESNLPFIDEIVASINANLPRRAAPIEADPASLSPVRIVRNALANSLGDLVGRFGKHIQSAHAYELSRMHEMEFMHPRRNREIIGRVYIEEGYHRDDEEGYLIVELQFHDDLELRRGTIKQGKMVLTTFEYDSFSLPLNASL